MKIALDAMGGDHAPQVPVEGAVQGAREYGVDILLVGSPPAIENELKRHDSSGLSISIVPASQVVEMDEQPAAAVKSKPDSSLVVGTQMLKRGQVDGFLTLGNSGGALAAALLHLGRIPGIKRPAIATLYPTSTDRGFCILLDIGANADCRPEYLYQFALMGSLFAKAALGIDNPRVATVSNGEEDSKGNALVLETHALLEHAPFNFVGNAEGKDIPAGLADVVVCDGFTGNVILKTSEGVAKLMTGAIKSSVEQSIVTKFGALLMKPALKSAAAMLDYREYGSAVLLGVDGVVLIGHGRSDVYATCNAIRMTKWAYDGNVVGAIKNGISAEETSSED